jgi:Cys-tRNA(Pro) deacylase
MNTEVLSKSVDEVQKWLTRHGFTNQVKILSNSAGTAKEAADTLSCKVEQIAKSLIFKTENNKPILVVAGGNNTVNLASLAVIIGDKVEKANADFVKETTGFSIGGVPPMAYKQKVEAYIDSDLMNHSEIWAAAGDPKAVFKLTPDDLVKITCGKVVEIK